MRKLLGKLEDFRHTRLAKQVRIFPIRMTSFPVRTFDVHYSIESVGFSHAEEVGIHVIDGALLHAPSQMLARSRGDGTPEYLIRESNYEDIEHQVKFSRLFRNVLPDRADGANVEKVSNDRPVFVFGITRNKSNYYHVMIDDFPRLLLLIENFGTEFDILCKTDLPSFTARILQNISQTYGISLIPMPDAELVSIEAPVLVIEDVSKRGFHLTESCRSYLKDRASKFARYWPAPPTWSDGIYRRGLVPQSWKADNSNGKSFIKNNNVSILPSVDAIRSLQKVKEMVGTNETGAGEAITIVGRGPSARPVRKILNESDLVQAIPGARVVDFGAHGLDEQIAIADQSKAMIGVSGAGLTNAVFMRPGSKVIEICPTSISFPPPDHFEHICTARGIIHTMLCEPPVDNADNINPDPSMIRDRLN
jgi:hypothetical protein